MQLRSQYKPLPLFDSPGFSHDLDGKRLTGLAEAVYNLMSDGRFYTFGEIKTLINRGSENGIAATIRRFRKLPNHTVELRRRGEPKNGLWEYRLNINE